MSTEKCTECNVKHRKTCPIEEKLQRGIALESYLAKQRIKEQSRQLERERTLNIDILSTQFENLYVQHPKLREYINLLEQQIEYLEYQ